MAIDWSGWVTGERVTYSIFCMCDHCGVPHSLNYKLRLIEHLDPDQPIGDAYAGTEVPADILSLIKTEIKCPATQKPFAISAPNVLFAVRHDGTIDVSDQACAACGKANALSVQTDDTITTDWFWCQHCSTPNPITGHRRVIFAERA
jgi:ferredoxin-like protein FixX